MEYERKYKAALKWMQSLYSGLHGATKEEAEKYFPELKDSEDERIVKCLLNYFNHVRYNGLDLKGTDVDEVIAWLEKQDKKKPVDEVMKIRQELYQSGYNDGYKHGRDDIAISLEKKSVEALEHFVRSIGESGYASPYDNRTKLVYRLLEQLEQIVK